MYFARNLISAGVLALLASTAVGSSVGVAFVRREAQHLPGLTGVTNWHPRSTTVMLAADGSVLGRFATENRTVIPLAAIPPTLIQAFVSAEDKTFWTHKGIDPAAIARALITDIRYHGSRRRPIGASTIDQQVVKNLIVGDQTSLRRKIREALLAVKLDRELGKKKVMETYLNEVYLGSGAYGVAAASSAYFGKAPDRLDLAEMAFIAGMPKGPGNYDPVKHPDAALARRAYVLGRMTADGAVTPDQAAEAAREPLPTPARPSSGGPAEGWFSEAARRESSKLLGTSAVYGGGFTIRTSEDPVLQQEAEQSLRDGLTDYDRRHGWRGPLARLPAGTDLIQSRSWAPYLAAIKLPDGADGWSAAVVLSAGRDAIIGFADGGTITLPLSSLAWARPVTGPGMGAVPRRASDILSPGDIVMIDRSGGEPEMRQIPQAEGALVAIEAATGRVLAIAGGFSSTAGAFDRVTQSFRQPGSTFKPFIYLTALEKGYDGTSPLLDSPVSIDLGANSAAWEPASDGDRGMGLITLRKGLEMSRNFASVRLLYDLGLPAVEDTVKKFGLYPALPNFAAALGALDTSDLALTSAYATFANGGHKVDPTLLDEIDGPDGKPVWKRPSEPSGGYPQIADPVAVAHLRSILEGVVRHGTAARELAGINLPIAGKTGTTNDNRDAWFVGFTPSMAVGVHIGFDHPASLGPKEFGALAAAPVFGQFVQVSASRMHTSGESFTVPAGAKETHVDPATGSLSGRAPSEILRSAPLSVAVPQ
jgi:penicillin-binding protein 1A